MCIKKQLRERMRAALNAMDPMSRYARSLAACKLFTSQPEFQAADTVMIFLSLSDEVDTSPIALAAWRAGKTVVAPKACWDTRRLVPMEIKSLDTDVATGRFGVPEPAVGGAPVPVEMLDLIATPALAFDLRGNRLGRGGGFFDRLFENSRCRALKCGLAFHDQVVQEVPAEVHDVVVDRIVTDDGIIDCRRNKTAAPGS